LELAKLSNVYLNITRGGIEEESENGEVGVGPRVGSLANANTDKRGPPSEAALDRVVPSPIVMGKDPAVGEAGEGYDENVEVARESLQVIGVHCNLTIAAVKERVCPLPEHVVGGEVALGFIEVSPARDKVGMKGRGRSEGREIKQGRCEDRAGRVGEVGLRANNNIEGVKGRMRKGSRDRTENKPSGLKPIKKPRVIANRPNSDVQKEPQGGSPGRWARMGGLPDSNTRKRMIRAEEIGEVREGTQQGRSNPPP
jgi:hypothetical protein